MSADATTAVVGARAVGVAAGGAVYSPGIQAVVAHIEANFRAPILLRELAAIARTGAVQLATRFRREVGTPPRRFQCDLRVRAAQDLLRQGLSPAAAALEVGFFDQSHMTRHFKRVLGSTPGRCRGRIDAARSPGTPPSTPLGTPPEGVAGGGSTR